MFTNSTKTHKNARISENMSCKTNEQFDNWVSIICSKQIIKMQIFLMSQYANMMVSVTIGWN